MGEHLFKAKRKDNGEWVGRMNKSKQPCWDCANAQWGKCPWFTGFKPVPGWIATPTVIKNSRPGGSIRRENSYEITYCPNHAREQRGADKPMPASWYYTPRIDKLLAKRQKQEDFDAEIT